MLVVPTLERKAAFWFCERQKSQSQFGLTKSDVLYVRMAGRVAKDGKIEDIWSGIYIE